MSAGEVQASLHVLAARLTAQGHYLQAIKCYTALLGPSFSLLPADEATVRLKLAQLLLLHTHNVTDAKQHLQKADLLVRSLPGQQLLKCEVLAQLGRSHKFLGETAFQRQCYLKGLEMCTDTSNNSNSNRRALAEWAVYFHLHAAESHTFEGQAGKAAEHAGAGCKVAQEAGMLEQQMLCLLFQLQLSLLAWDKDEAGRSISLAQALLQQLETPGTSTAPGLVALLKLQFTMMQVVLLIHQGNFQELSPDKDKPPPIIADMESQLDGLQALTPHSSALAYSWLPGPALAAMVQLLAAIILKPGGKVKQALVHISRGLQLVDEQLTSLGLGPTSTEACLDHINTYSTRALLVLRLLLLETRQQLHLLSSSFAAARQDAAANIQLLLRFPSLLVNLRASVHVQAGLYAQAVGAFDVAMAHFSKVASSQDSHMSVCARCLAAMCRMAQDTPGAVSHGRELLGELLSVSGSELGYAERAAAFIAGGLVLAAPGTSADERADAKQKLSKALKLAHGRLQNHQLVSQVLLFMTPLQVSAADTQGALQMVNSSFTLAKGGGDLQAQVAGLSMLQQLFHHSKQPDKAASNFNYLARKQEELSARIQEAEANTQQHLQVLQWDL